MHYCWALRCFPLVIACVTLDQQNSWSFWIEAWRGWTRFVYLRIHFACHVVNPKNEQRLYTTAGTFSGLRLPFLESLRSWCRENALMSISCSLARVPNGMRYNSCIRFAKIDRMQFLWNSITDGKWQLSQLMLNMLNIKTHFVELAALVMVCWTRRDVEVEKSILLLNNNL